MWKIKQFFDGDFGCEELAPGEKSKVSVTLENEEGQTKFVSVEDAWLKGLSIEEDAVFEYSFIPCKRL